MLKFIVLCFAAISAIPAVSQNYVFDYKIEAETKKSADSEADKIIFYINSKDNSYILSVNDLQKAQSKIHFFDVEDEITYLNMNYGKSDDLSSLKIKSQDVNRFKNPFKKKQVKNYHYTILQDTLIEGTYYRHYIISHLHKDVAKRKNIGVKHYIVSKDNDALPILLPETASYEVWKSEGRKLPRGMLRESYMVMPDGTVQNIVKYLVYTKIKTTLTIE